MKLKTELTNIKIKVKEEYLDLVPRPTKEERQSLKEDIMLNGQSDPIVINRDGFILDGYTRYEICQELGIDIKYRIQGFKTKEEEKRYVINCNVRRRHLNSFQRVELMYKIYLMEKDLAKHRYYNGKNYGKSKGSASEIVGRTIGLNRNTVSKAVYVMEHGNTDMIDKARRGVLGIDKAYIILKKPYYAKSLFKKRYIKNDTKVICPKCQNVSKKVEWKIA